MIVDLEQRWRSEEMRCLRKNPEMFFTDQGTETMAHPSNKIQNLWDRAKRVCADCPVLKECARDNLGEIEGVWGGLDPAQRAKIRKTHGQVLRRLTGELKEEYAKLAYDLRTERHMTWPDIGRVMGFDFKTAQYLHAWWESHLRQAGEETTDLELPEVAEVVEINVNAQYPDKPPSQGDGWVRYGRRVVWGYYLGQTEDDAWYSMKIKLLAQEYSVCWVKAEDVRLTRSVARNVLTRVGNGSRIYGTSLSRRRTPQAG